MEWKSSQIQDVKNNIVKIPNSWVYLKYYEAFNLLFRVENALRVFVYIILKNEFREKWAEINISLEESGSSTISSIAKKRLGQAQSFGYLGHTIATPIMYLTSGELTRLIVDDAYWKLFKTHFKGNRDIIKNKMEEIASIRNSLAHFRPIKDDDLTAIKHNAKHVLMGVEEFLSQVLNQPDVVPTNTEDIWYKLFKTLKNDLCNFTFYQSTDSNWIKINLSYKSLILISRELYRSYRGYDLLTLDSSSILTIFPNLTNMLTYMTEYVPYVSMPAEGNPSFRKNLGFVFAKSIFLNNEDELKTNFSKLINKINEESNLIQQDNLARGTLISSTYTNANGKERNNSIEWEIQNKNLYTPEKSDNPSEYWGNAIGYTSDFVAGTTKYPWMPEAISEYESIF